MAQWNHCLRTYCNKSFKGWIAGINPFRQLIEMRTLGRPGILATHSYPPLACINKTNMFKYGSFFLNLVGADAFLLPLKQRAGTSNSCTADKENPRKNKHETIERYASHISAEAPWGKGSIENRLPTSRSASWHSTNWAIGSLVLESANLLSNVLTYFFRGCTAT